MDLTRELKITAKLILMDWDITEFEALQIAAQVQSNEIALRSLTPEIKISSEGKQRVFARSRTLSPCGPSGCKPKSEKTAE